MSNIQSNTQVASSSSETISASANGLQKKEITKDNESNITAKEASIVAYERGDSLKFSYQEALKLDADHIQELLEATCVLLCILLIFYFPFPFLIL